MVEKYNGESTLNSIAALFYYHPRMRIGKNFSRGCLSFRAITFQLLQLGMSFLVNKYILTISRSSFNIRVIGSR